VSLFFFQFFKMSSFVYRGEYIRPCHISYIYSDRSISCIEHYSSCVVPGRNICFYYLRALIVMSPPLSPKPLQLPTDIVQQISSTSDENGICFSAPADPLTPNTVAQFLVDLPEEFEPSTQDTVVVPVFEQSSPQDLYSQLPKSPSKSPVRNIHFSSQSDREDLSPVRLPSRHTPYPYPIVGISPTRTVKSFIYTWNELVNMSTDFSILNYSSVMSLVRDLDTHLCRIAPLVQSEYSVSEAFRSLREAADKARTHDCRSFEGPLGSISFCFRMGFYGQFLMALARFLEQVGEKCYLHDLI
jgi:hypothetical protein